MAPGSDRGASAAVDTASGGAVVVTGAAGPLGRAVVALAAEDPEVPRVVALDRKPMRDLPAGVERHQVDLATAALDPLLAGAAAVLHLDEAGPPRAGMDISEPTGEAEVAARVLAAAGAAGVPHVVVLSSALVYGAWPTNPVPLTEDAPVRPNPGVAVASERAAIEGLAARWREAHPGATATVLRPTTTVSPRGNGWVARALGRRSTVPVGDDEPPAQFLDLDDLAAAVDLARRLRIDGARNVAPDGWVSGETVRALAARPRVPVPEPVAVRLAAARWRWGISETPPALLPYTVHPWVVANDRLRADGWAPASTNEEAYVASHRVGPWATLSPRRRQEIALGASGAAIVGSVVGAVSLLRRRSRR